MGINLILKKGDEYIADLGRSYNYDGGVDAEEIENELHEIIANMKSDMLSKIAYTPKDYDDLNKIVSDAEESIQYYVDTLLNIGERSMLSKILKDDVIRAVKE